MEIEHLEAELQRLCGVVTAGDKEGKPHVLFVQIRVPNGPIVTYNCTWLDMTDDLVFRAGFFGGYISFMARMVKDLEETTNTAGNPAHVFTLGSAEAWKSD